MNLDRTPFSPGAVTVPLAAGSPGEATRGDWVIWVRPEWTLESGSFPGSAPTVR